MGRACEVARTPRRRRATVRGADGQWSSGLTDSVASGGCATPIIGRTCDACRPRLPGIPAMTQLLPTTIAGSLPKPAWLAEPERALGAVAARRRRARRGQARRRAPRAARPGAGGHRHRHRRRADAPPLRDDVHRRPRRRRLRAQARPCASATATTPTCRWSSARSRAGIRSSSTTRGSCAATTDRKVKYTLPGPMTMVDTLYDAHYKSREKLAWAFAEILNEEARAIEAAGVDVIQFDEPAFNVYFDEVRDWGVRDARARRAGPRAARPPCTSATATASRPTSTGRRRSAPSGGSTSRRFRCSRARRSTRCRSNARTRTCRSSSSGSSRARTCWSARSTSRPTGSRRRRTSPRRSARRSRYVPAERLYPCTNCGMVPLARDVARGKLRALGGGRRAGPGRGSRAVRRGAGRPMPAPTPGHRTHARKTPFRARKIPLAPAELVVYPPQSVLFQGSKYALYDRFAVVPPSFFP